MNKNTLISLILVIVWMGVIFILSDMNTTESNKNSSSIVTGVINTVDNLGGANNDTKEKHNESSYVRDINTIFRKCCHAFCYLALYILVFNFIIRVMKKRLLIYSIISIIICILYAISDEIHQSFVFGRTGQFTDVLIDSIGIVIGCIFISIIYNKYKKKLVK